MRWRVLWNWKLKKEDDDISKLTLRPIISNIGTATYELAKYLSRFLEPLSKNEYTILNTSDLIGRLRNEEQIPPNYALVSFDVQSLFTNVPLNRTLDIIMERIYKNNDIITDIPSKDLKDLLLLCTKQVHFQYDGSNYLQSEGVAMGSPLGHDRT